MFSGFNYVREFKANFSFLQLREKFPTKKLPQFPRKQLFHNPKDVEYRRCMFENYLQEVLKDEDIRNSWELQYFLRVKTHVNFNLP